MASCTGLLWQPWLLCRCVANDDGQSVRWFPDRSCTGRLSGNYAWKKLPRVLLPDWTIIVRLYKGVVKEVLLMAMVSFEECPQGVVSVSGTVLFRGWSEYAA